MSETHRDHKAQTLPPLPFLKRDRLMFHHCINLKKVYSNTSFAFSFIFWIRFAHDGLPCSIMFYQSVSVLAYASLSQVKRLVTRPIFSVCICCFQLDERAIKSCSLYIYIYAQYICVLMRILKPSFWVEHNQRSPSGRGPHLPLPYVAFWPRNI